MDTRLGSTFPKKFRLTARRHYQQMADGTAFRWMGESVIVEIKPNLFGWPRLGITATRRYGKAHVRNRFKRVVREAFRVLGWTDFQALDILVKPKKMSVLAKMDTIQGDLVLAIKRFLTASAKKLALTGKSSLSQ